MLVCGPGQLQPWCSSWCCKNFFFYKQWHNHSQIWLAAGQHYYCHEEKMAFFKTIGHQSSGCLRLQIMMGWNKIPEMICQMLYPHYLAELYPLPLSLLLLSEFEKEVKKEIEEENDVLFYPTLSCSIPHYFFPNLGGRSGSRGGWVPQTATLSNLVVGLMISQPWQFGAEHLLVNIPSDVNISIRKSLKMGNMYCRQPPSFHTVLVPKSRWCKIWRILNTINPVLIQKN